MITPPRQTIAGVQGKRCRIVPAPSGRYVLFCSDGAIRAEHSSPRWLSESALMSGAQSVAWDFDLRIIEE